MSSEREADQQLVERVQRGDKRAFDVLVAKYQHKVANLVSRYVRDSSEVLEDIDVHRSQYRVLAWEVEPGDCIVFSALTIHGNGGNR